MDAIAISGNLEIDEVPFLDRDVVLAPYIERARHLVASGSIKETVESIVDEYQG